MNSTGYSYQIRDTLVMRSKGHDAEALDPRPQGEWRTDSELTAECTDLESARSLIPHMTELNFRIFNWLNLFARPSEATEILSDRLPVVTGG